MLKKPSRWNYNLSSDYQDIQNIPFIELNIRKVSSDSMVVSTSQQSAQRSSVYTNINFSIINRPIIVMPKFYY